MTIKTPNSFLTGLLLVLTTVLFWGILPVALVFSLELQDGTTITWFRFLVAGIVCLAYQAHTGKLREFNALSMKEWGMLTLAAAFLIGDYVLFIYGLTYIEPSAMTVFSQATPLFLALSGILFFGERIGWLQAVSGAALFLGLGMFFNASIVTLDLGQEGFVTGAIIAVAASFIWVLYATLQKKLVDRLSSTNILLFIYFAAIVTLAPVSDMGSFSKLNTVDWLILIFCALNTLVAYAAFSESMNYWPSTHISSVVATTPIITILASLAAHELWPSVVRFTPLNNLAWAGVIVTLSAAIAFNLPDRRHPTARKEANA